MWFKSSIFTPSKHDQFCMGEHSPAMCACDSIKAIREDERKKVESELWGDGYISGRSDAAKAVKEKLKNFKKSFRKSVVAAAKGDQK